ncbi:Asp-tRNA(Asn)/Glu-tRNA(Gln) amidotransferase subunit GatB [Rhodopirellula sp. MGV]|uniref:Asp-tRNA(Asn)/Glu-tRNA(Gln) amidotransferase subunit GatB n=1 Tax=Rhodopirellula sp. MGV TaxID=2023130 RepID=UPI000B96C668|nr:Asp-tRNA(Asn)/Glu-tRNA(Gln) amidotransferase subunit GatB [Rhodopirellula sp. MGV]OYP30347.1 Asp-tRNA(Asn)/Glu-tRNA(Gln) amidotransferase GatCAB subunit B [Rhodopirellula sp. MGV]PNY34703.1 Asp-tRNA(Asn)/Glu-tRNA(Gln) amidotransferase subunit GatB [Rhodopirellula baltica]
MAELPTKTIIGLEVHVQLRTKTKLFCGCSTKFGGAPNTQVCPVCLGLPGALPVINEQAIELAIRAGLAIDCDIPPMTKWDRKQYFYPDLPKGYQISQFDLPICVDGVLEIEDPADPDATRKIRITRAHLEEDAGKSMHDEAAGSGDSRIDLNRCGTPLLEIVSEPDLRTAEECLAYLTKLKETMVHLGVSDCEMQEGSLRVDANVNLEIDRHGEVIRTPIVEIKNMNSFRNVASALHYEVKRQYAEWEENGWTKETKGKRTFGWDDVKEVTYPQREKEESADYRYFPCPDLLPVRITQERVEEIRQTLGETPGEARQRLQKQYGIKEYDADVIVSQGRAMVEYFDEVATQCGDGKRASSWIQQDVLRTLKEQNADIETFPVGATELGQLLAMVSKGELPNDRARDVFKHILENGGSVENAVSSLGIEAVDESELESLVQSLLDANPKVVEDLQNGNQKAIGPLIGQAKKKNPNADPQTVRQIALRLIEQA